MGSYQSSLGWGLILAAAAGLGAASARSARPDTGHLTPVTFSSPDTLRSRALHVLNRLTYGPRPGDVDRVMAMGIDRFIEAQLDPDGTNDDALEERYPQLVVLARSPLELAEMVAEAQRQRMARRRAMRDSVRPVPRSPIPESPLRRITGAFQQAAILRAAVSERQLYEIMVDFWFNHFNVHFGKGAVRFTGPPYLERTIRPRALGRFEDLLIATAQSPAMLFYLDNVQSVAPGSEPPEMQRQRTAGRQGRQPAQPRMDSLRQRLQRRMPRGLNENYARELLELHTLGVGGGYTQDDVINVARILTGWSMDRATFASAFVFNDWAHDRGEKRVLGRTFPAGQGMAEGIELLKILASHPATMRHVGAKLCARFVNDEPPAGCVDAAVRGWQRSGGEIREVLRAILQSPEFWAPENRGAKI